MADLYSNFGRSTLAGGASGSGVGMLEVTDTTLYVLRGTGDVFPQPTGARSFMLALGAPTGATEIVRCVARSGDQFTIVRGQEGTAAVPWPIGTQVAVALTAGEMQNLWTALTPFIYNVKSFGAQGDGSTDDTAAIQAAITAATLAGGGTVWFPAGTYITQTLTLGSYVHLRGDGISASVLQLKSGTNGDLLNGGAANVALINLEGSIGSGDNGGLANWSIKEMTLDGNKAGQTGPPGVCRSMATATRSITSASKTGTVAASSPIGMGAAPSPR
ncbi:MAG TPA: glycosyl hydrolase family 28-related protein [Ktedonobacterales bacterium]|nr:glycosyl hydrolase family 28-related protein [Ktedonobacterales bacterium]